MELSLSGNDWQLVYLMPHEWENRKVWEQDWNPRGRFPATDDWIKGTVPGDVIADALDAGLITEPYKDMNSRACEWLSQRDWVYRKTFDVDGAWQGKHVRLKFAGVDFSCRVYLNGVLLGTHEGMFVPFEYDVSQKLQYGGSNSLTVVVMHAPPVDVVQGQVGHTSDARVWKSRFAYNWDWCTRLIPVGIWQDVALVATDGVFIENLWVRPQVDESGAAAIRVSIAAKATTDTLESAEATIRVLDPAGNPVGEAKAAIRFASQQGSAEQAITVPDPQLWWPNGMGNQPLYVVEAELAVDAKVSDSASSTCGLRRIRMIANEGAPSDALPYTVEVNGRRMFIKGWNWVPIDHMYGRVQQDRYEHLLGLAKHAHCNFLRVWGGGLLERREFYDLCDRLGITVWQEFMQSSSGVDNHTPSDPEYLKYIESQARAIVPQRRNHASLIIWCGGNELMKPDFTPLTSEDPALAVLKRVANELDPDRGWFPTSASGPSFSPRKGEAGKGVMHDIHGPWKYGGPTGQYDLFNNIDPLLHAEFGVEGAANLETLRKFISPKYLWPPDETNPAWVHHASWWLHRERITELFGEVDNIEDFVRCSQLMQAEGLRYTIESNRRRKWLCSGTIPWQFNEAFPNASCTNCVDYMGLPKPAYWWVRRAYEPVHISMKYDKLNWKPGETWRGEMRINNSGGLINDAKWSAKVMALDGRLLSEDNGTIELGENQSSEIAVLQQAITTEPLAAVVLLRLDDASGKSLSRNEYFFSNAERPLQPLREAPKVRLEVTKSESGVAVRNASPVPALMIAGASGTGVTPDEDYFCLAPYETVVVGGVFPRALNPTAWNSE